ncbi:lipoprotein insertase outer membrane protein LolB [Aestuariibacter sp. A3R04]|uniref:lipoprotein insertase outer membrane protein LolB n=1 Tax=Aestuariibacter sp. A3R04 TaxID=2841571 RepID=UPI001C09E5DF|nr:lipoprotein insertase outer membrane protein LolB [Aestuariibacter sp. A3R04]MBU3022577.1 lipoprotein insertase outer membrane protein LolB [Aestuariibacter sp. A3R04]
MNFRIVLTFAAAVGLSACTIAPDGPQTAVDLPLQLEKLKNVTHWQISGKMAVRTKQEAVSANLNWKTDGTDFDFRLSNVLGVTLAHMAYRDGIATLRADGKTYTHTDPSVLIYQVTNWDIPIAKLQNWIKGLPLEQDSYRLNDKQLLTSLSPGCSACGFWQVNYDQYSNIDDLWLPHQLTLTQPHHSTTMLKIKINQWTIR